MNRNALTRTASALPNTPVAASPASPPSRRFVMERTTGRKAPWALALCVAIGLMVSPLSAEISEPDHIIYGYATTDGVPLESGLVELRLEEGAPPLARFDLAADPATGNRFVLRVPMDSVGTRIPGRARSGDAALLFINGQPAGRTVIGSRGAVQLYDADPVTRIATPSFSIANASLVEGDSGTSLMNFEISLSAASSDEVLAVDWETRDGSAVAGSDYNATGGTAIFDPGDVTQVVSVEIIGDTVDAVNENFFVDLSNPTPDTTPPTVEIAVGTAQGTILDDDTPPTISINDSSLKEPDTGQENMTFQVSLSHTWKNPVTATVTTTGDTATGNSDYQSTSQMVTIPAGDLVATAQVPINADAEEDEGPETFFVNLSSPTQGSILDGQGVGTILDAAQILTFLEKQLEGASSVDGLVGPYSVAEYGDFIYVAGRSPGSIVIFERLFSGNLSFIGVVEKDPDTEAALNSLSGVEDLSISPDGEHLYAAAYGADSVLVFARDATSGLLTLLEVESDGVDDLTDTHPVTGISGNTVNGLEGAAGLAMDSTGTNLYVTGFTDNAVAVFTRESDSGDPDFGKISYQEVNVDLLSDGNGGTVDGAAGATAAIVSPDDSHLYVAANGENAIGVFTRLANGGLAFLEVKKDGAAGADGLGGAVALDIDPTGTHLYVAGQTDSGGAIAVFERATGARGATPGTLTFKEVHRNGAGTAGTQGLLGARSVDVSFDGRYVYTTGYSDNALSVFERSGDGTLTYREVKKDGTGVVDGLEGATDVLESADGQYIYGAGNQENALAVFRRDLLPPDNPTSLISTSHTTSVWSNDPTIDVQWAGATDDVGGAGLDGYSFLFDLASATDPDETVDELHGTDPHTTTSVALADGNSHWFHLRTCDDANNCATTAHLGPFFIDQTAPENPDLGDIEVTSFDGAETGPVFTVVQLEATWPAVDTSRSASDSGSGVAFFDVGFSTVDPSLVTCGEEEDVVASTAGPHSFTSEPLANGTYYFVICTADEAGNWSEVTGVGPLTVATSDSTPPTVTNVDTVTATSDGTLIEVEEIGPLPVTQFRMSFSEEMFDGTGADAASNDGNYRLLGPGPDESFQTVGCETLSGDDVQWPFASAAYAAQVTTLIVDGDFSLPAGSYRLIACGSTTLKDPSGNPLDGVGNGNLGIDFVRDFSVVADNLLRNPNFDDPLFSFWVPSDVTAGQGTADLDGAATSGSAEMEPPGVGENTVAAAQCFELPGTLPEDVMLAGWARIDSDDPGASAVLEVEYFDDVNCSGDSLGTVASSAVIGDTADGWSWLTSGVSTPPGTALWAKVTAVASRTTADAFLTEFDSIFFGEVVPEIPIFADGFESGDMTLWAPLP